MEDEEKVEPVYFDKSKFSDEESKFLLKLQFDQNLKHDLEGFRRHCNVPRDGFDTSKPITGNKKELRLVDFDRLVNCTNILLARYNLTSRWYRTFVSTLLFNEAYPPSHVISSISIFREDRGVMIEVTENIPIAEIKKYLTSKRLKKPLSELPGEPRSTQKLNRISAFTEAQKIKSSNSGEKKKWREIIDDLIARGHGGFLPENGGDHELGMYVSRVKKRVINESKTYYNLVSGLMSKYFEKFGVK